MKIPGFLLASLLLLPAWVHAQRVDAPEGATIAAAQVSGFDLKWLSIDLQEEIGRLAGGPIDRDHLKNLCARIEEEQPRRVAAVRAVEDVDGVVRVVFVVAHQRDQDREREANVNDRYIIESAEVRGVRRRDLDPQLRGDLQTLAGKRLDSDDVVRLESRLKAALPGYEVGRSVTRGSRSGEVRLLFVVRQAEAARWLRFESLKSELLYHSTQGWGALLHLPISSRNFHVTPIVAIDHADDLIEEYSGFGVRFEARRLGTERLGASFEWSTFDPDWRDATLTALDLNAGIPPIYDQRSTVTPSVSFAVTRELTVRGGFSATALDPVDSLADTQKVNAAIASIEYDRTWERDTGARHFADVAFRVRAASDRLDSDLAYTRYVGQGAYRYHWRKQQVLLSGMAGRVNGDAPIYERFALGDSETLRGWNKYDIAPAGGARAIHASLEYRNRGLALFLDTGAVWDAGADARVRVATGFGFHPGPVFFTVGFPLNADELSAVFTMGIRFSGVGARKY